MAIGIGIGLSPSFGGGVAGPSTYNVVFGALTRTGTGGGIVTAATSITSGNGLGHFQITGGYLCLAATIGAGPYTLVLNNGDTYNVTVEANCWSCATQAEWDFLIAQATATLSGKIIRVRRLPSNAVYTSGVDGVVARLRRADYGGLIIKGDDTSTGVVQVAFNDTAATTLPLFNRFVLRGTRNVTFDAIDFDSTTAKKFDMIGEAANALTGITIRNCRIRGQVGNTSPSHDYTGRITSLQIGTGDGVTTTFGWTSPYQPGSGAGAGSALYNGTAGISPNPQGVRVVAGAVTAATTGGGTTLSGTGVASGTVNYTTGVVSVTFSAAPANGEPILLTANTQWMYPNDDMLSTSRSGAATISGITIENNYITWCLRGMNVTATAPTTTITGNLISWFYDDGLQLNYSTADSTATVADNITFGPLGIGTDVGNPHVDHIRFAAATTATTDWTINVWRNRMYRGGSRGDHQGILASDFKSGGTDSGYFFVANVIGNVFVGTSTVCCQIENAKNAVVLNNTIVDDNTAVDSSISIAIGTGSSDATTSGTHRIERNITEALNVGGSPTLVDNILVTTSPGPNEYANVFDGPIGIPSSLTDLMTWFDMKAGGPADLSGGPPDAGAIGATAVTWATTVPGDDGANLVS